MAFDPALPDPVLDQAIAWLVRLQSGDADETQRQACLAWRAADATHERAWQALQRSEAGFQALASLPPTLALDTLERAARTRGNRRQALKLLGIGGLLAGAGGLGWQASPWGTADYAARVGERRQFTLADGSRLQLNTDSAVDIRGQTVRLRRGELFVETAHPLWLDARQARLQVLNGALTVRQEADHLQVQVVRGDVDAYPAAAQPTRLVAGPEYRIAGAGTQTLAESPLDPLAWTRGQLVARHLRLDRLAAEFSRYRRGWLGCDPRVADLQVSGAFQLDDPDRALAALCDSLPVRLERFGPYWTRIVAA